VARASSVRAAPRDRSDDGDLFRDIHPEAAAAYPRNFAANVIYSIFIRMGWVYKTESTVIPGFVTALTRDPVAISLTPIVSRLSQYLPQFFLLGAIERAHRKKPLLILATSIFALSWGSLSAVLWFGRNLSPRTLLVVFLLAYGSGWVCTGVQVVIDRVMMGRLIPARRRGRILAVSGPVGSYSVVFSGPIIAYLLSHGGDFPRNYAIVFGIGFVTFLIALSGAALLVEPKDEDYRAPEYTLGDLARQGWALLRQDATFRDVFLLAAIQTLSGYLFSYYVAYARLWSEDPGFQSSLNATLGWGLSVQNIVIGTLSLSLGLLVDWKGNRVVMVGLSSMLALVPLVAVAIGRFVPEPSRLMALLVLYAMIGGMAVLMRVMSNYVLEIAPSERQALYVGIFGSGQIVTLAFPLLIGAGIRWARGPLGEMPAYEAAFLICAGVLLVSVWIAARLPEPRFAEMTIPDRTGQMG